MANRKTDKAKWEKLLEALMESGNISAACDVAGVPRSTAYDHKANDEQFADAWQAALELGIASLEDECNKRARAGSDTLLIFLLKAHKPEKYRERYSLHHSGNIGLKEILADIDGSSKGLPVAASEELTLGSMEQEK